MRTALSCLRRARRVVGAWLGRQPRVRRSARVPRLRIGSDYGGWTICPDPIGATSVVYSVGLGSDISFDLGMIERFGVTVFGFDPTPASLEWLSEQALPDKLQVHNRGLAAIDGGLRLFEPSNPAHVSYSILKTRPDAAAIEVPVARLETLMKQLGHDHVDLLKMDIEGAEYEVIRDLVESGVEIGQLLVEFHHCRHGISVAMTEAALRQLETAGYELFWISDSGYEYSFINRSRWPESCVSPTSSMHAAQNFTSEHC